MGYTVYIKIISGKDFDSMTNAIIENIKARRSIRGYTDELPTQEMVDTLIECAFTAPNGLGKQGWHFTICYDRALMDEITEGNKQLMLSSGKPDQIEKASAPDFDNFRGAPMAILVSADTAAPFCEADCANATTIMALAAQSMGLGTCYLAGFKRFLLTPEGADCLKRLELPEGVKPLFALAVGYPAKAPKERHAPKENAVNVIGTRG